MRALFVEFVEALARCADKINYPTPEKAQLLMR